jgi:hypothetical protein
MTSLGYSGKKKAGVAVAAPRAAAAAAPPPAHPAAGPATVTTTLSHEKVAKLAYEIWVKKGRIAGRDFENWREAEAQLRMTVQTR